MKKRLVNTKSPITTGIILAGGGGQRLGCPKFLYKIDEQSLIERVARHISSVCDHLLIVTNQEHLGSISDLGLQAKLVIDFWPGKGPLNGIYTGLSSSETFYNLVVGCDMPTLNINLLSHLIEIAPGFDAVVPELKCGIESLHAIYTKNCIVHIKQLLDQGILPVSQLFSKVNTRRVCEDEIDALDPSHLSFININTDEDAIKVEAIIRNRVTSSRFQSTM